MEEFKQRIKVMCVFNHQGKTLASKGYDHVKDEVFYRLIGGTIDFGEKSEDGIRREIQEELKIKQNKISFRISTDHGDANKFAQLISGGNYSFWDHDSAGYYFQAHLSIDEEFLKKIIIKHIRLCFKEMKPHESKFSIFSILPRDKVNDQFASDILKRITKAICDEINQDMGSIIIEERLRR